MAARKKELDPNRAIGIVRRSTDKQKNTAAVQADYIQKWCARNGIELVAIFFDTVSGKAAIEKRPGLQAACKALREVNAKLLVTDRPDRWMRETYFALQAEFLCTEAGGEFRFADGTPVDDSGMSKFIRTMAYATAELDGHNIRRRIRDVKRIQRAAGQTYGRPPYGFKSVDKKLVADETEQNIIRYVRSLYSRGATEREIVERLNADGHKTRKGTAFTKTFIHTLIQRWCRKDGEPPKEGELVLKPTG